MNFSLVVWRTDEKLIKQDSSSGSSNAFIQGNTIMPHTTQYTRRLRRSTEAARRYLPGALLALVGLTASTLVLAQSNTNSKHGAYETAMGSSYIGLSAGTSDLTRPITAFGLFGGSQQGRAYSVAVGNYFTNQNYGVELGYTDFGSVNRAGTTTKVDGINISLIGRIPVSSTFNLLGKLGTTYGRTDVTATPGSGVVGGSERGFDWSYGIGGEIVLTPLWSALLQYDEHYVKYPSSNNERVSNTTLGVRFHY
jgi:hypothetical protein